MIDLGWVRPSSTIYIPFNTFDSNDPSASVTISAFAVGDIKIFKNGNATERASTAGYALLDTDGIDFSAETGIHGFSINLADNTDAGFYMSGQSYWVIVGPITVDAATVNFVAATFRIGYPNAVLNTNVATVNSQVSFELDAGPPEHNVLNGCPVLFHDLTTDGRIGFAHCYTYTAGAKTITLEDQPEFSIAVDDHVIVLPRADVGSLAGSTVAARNLRRGATGVIWGDVSGTPSTVSHQSNVVQYADDELIGRRVVFISGIANGQAAEITDYASTNGTFTYAAITTAAQAGDEFIVI